MLIQMAISRQREFAADRGGAEIVGIADGAGSALRRIEAAAQQMPMDANPATAHMFIMNPFAAMGGSRSSSRPPADRRARAGADGVARRQGVTRRRHGEGGGTENVHRVFVLVPDFCLIRSADHRFDLLHVALRRVAAADKASDSLRAGPGIALEKPEEVLPHAVFEVRDA